MFENDVGGRGEVTRAALRADLVLHVRVERAAELADGGEVSSADQPLR